MRTQHLIVIRLVPGLEGVWMAVEPGKEPAAVWNNGEKIGMVPTGDVEWDGDTPAEVYVPADRIIEWRAEHRVDG